MSEIRETLRFTSTDLEEMNRVMGRLQDRLDALEGLRGQAAFYGDVDFQDKRLLNVAQIAKEVTETTPTVSTSTIDTTFETPVVCQSTLETDGASSFKSTATVTGKFTANGLSEFNNSSEFNSDVLFGGLVTFMASVACATPVVIKKFAQIGTPSSSDIPDGGIALWDDTTGGYALCANFGGAIKTVALT